MLIEEYLITWIDERGYDIHLTHIQTMELMDDYGNYVHQMKGADGSDMDMLYVSFNANDCYENRIMLLACKYLQFIGIDSIDGRMIAEFYTKPYIEQYGSRELSDVLNIGCKYMSDSRYQKHKRLSLSVIPNDFTHKSN